MIACAEAVAAPRVAVSLLEHRTTFPPCAAAYLSGALGAAEFGRLCAALPLPPTQTTVRVNTARATVEEVLVELQACLAGFNAELASQGRPPVAVRRHAVLPDLLVIPSAAASTASTARSCGLKEVVVDRMCGEAVLRGADIFVKGVRGASAGTEEEMEVAISVDLDGVLPRGTEAGQFNTRKLFIGVGRTKVGRVKMLRLQRGLAVEVKQRVCCDAPPLNGVLPGRIFLQNLPSAVVAHVLAPQAGECVADLCASPGGKTTHVAALMSGVGLLVACDRSLRKASLVAANAAQMGVDGCVFALKMDSTKAVLDGKQPRLTTPAEARAELLRVVEEARAARRAAPTAEPNTAHRLLEGALPEQAHRLVKRRRARNAFSYITARVVLNVPSKIAGRREGRSSNCC